MQPSIRSVTFYYVDCFPCIPNHGIVLVQLLSPNSELKIAVCCGAFDATINFQRNVGCDVSLFDCIIREFCTLKSAFLQNSWAMSVYTCRKRMTLLGHIASHLWQRKCCIRNADNIKKSLKSMKACESKLCESLNSFRNLPGKVSRS